MKNFGIIALLMALAFGFAGCATTDSSDARKVLIKTNPPGAAVFIANEQVGTTPLKLKLDPRTSHFIRFEKPHFREACGEVATVPNDKAENFVKFGPLQEAGYYATLEPNPLEVDLEPEIVPTGVGADPFGEMAERVLELDKLLRQREITFRDYKYIVGKLNEFYEGQNEY